MLKILFFTIKRQFLSNFKNAESKLGLLSQLFFIVSLVLTGFGVGFGLDKAPTELISGFKIGLLLAYSSSLAMLAFVPDYKSRPRIVSKIHPIPAFKRWLVNITYDFFDAMTIGTFLTFIIVDITSKNFTSIELTFFILFLMNVKIAVYILKTIIEEIHAISYLKWLWVALLVAFIAVLVVTGLDSTISLLATLLTFILQIVLSITFEKHYIGISASKFTFNFLNETSLPAVYLAFLKSSKTRKGYLTGLVAKAIFLIFAANFDFSNRGISTGFFLVLYMTPTTIFSYFGNNVWGFYPEIWYSSVVTKPADTIKRYFQLMSFPLMIDFVMTFMILLFAQKLTFALTVFYFTATAMLIVNGYIFSHQKPVSVGEGLSFSQMKPKVYGWSSFISLFLVAFAILFKDYFWISMLIIAISGIIFYFLHKEFRADKKLNYDIFDILKG
jgi:hypothetical protein